MSATSAQFYAVCPGRQTNRLSSLRAARILVTSLTARPCFELYISAPELNLVNPRIAYLMTLLASPWTWLASLPLLLYLYVATNDRKLLQVPPEVLKTSPERVTGQEVLHLFERMKEKGDGAHPILEHLPPASGRRYIVIGGVSTLFVSHARLC
jgi:hypothetical protein